MSNTLRVWLIIEGPSGTGQVVAAAQRAPRRGRRVEVVVPAAALQTRKLWLLSRRDPADVILAVDVDPQPLEARRAALGKVAEQYQVVQVPLLERPPEHE